MTRWTRSWVFGALAGVTVAAGSWGCSDRPAAPVEHREPCASVAPLGNPYFGELHVHTAYSPDAMASDVRTGPREAYRFARGEPLDLPPYDAQGRATRTIQLRRPLDFAAVTDHAEMLGEVQICLTPGLEGYDSAACTGLRAIVGTDTPAVLGFVDFITPYLRASAPARHAFCGPDGQRCLGQASPIWRAIQDAAEEFYDRSSACRFTTFVAYEWTFNTSQTENLHRNVIFRTASVPALPVSYMEEQTAAGLWAALERDCLERGDGCDVLAIPHNSNLSNGLMFESPATAEEAAARAAFEPLVEITQHKGDSECRPGVGTTDELCGFEKMSRNTLTPAVAEVFPPLSFVRNALREGLAIERRLGANPFEFGLIGSTDTHASASGATEEADYQGHLFEPNAERMLSRDSPAGIEANPGGLAVVWAQENSREALFDAMRRREVYATSGTRPIVRFFAGDLPSDLCARPDFVEQGYGRGVPMGGRLGPVGEGAAAPRFAVLALADPGVAGAPGTRLQRVQIVKGWIDAQGETHEQIFEVAGDPGNGATVDLATCEPLGAGFDSLCAVWRDPEFDRDQAAFYYPRVVENPSCRWSTWMCNRLGVVCADPASLPEQYEECCNPAVPRTIQERAWASPIWYRAS